MKKVGLVLLFLLVALLLAATLSFVMVKQQIHQPLAKYQVVEVLYGDSVYKLANKLQAQHIFDYPEIFIAYARLSQQTTIRAGEYQLTQDMSLADLLAKLVAGQVIDYSLTLVEGKTVQQALTLIQQSNGIISTIDKNDTQAVLSAMGADSAYTHYEGLIFPDTYRYVKGTKDRDILRKAHLALTALLDQAWHTAQQHHLPYQNAYQLLVMASIVEKETAVADERKQIAGVFVQRLINGMRLQTDPTLIYAMGDSYKGRIGKKGLAIDSPYNTYRHKGLPPTPIALVSKASLMAAADPLLNGKLYFVAKGDGYHQFSSTLEQHNAAVKRYQLKRESSYRSVPLQEK